MDEKRFDQHTRRKLAVQAECSCPECGRLCGADGETSLITRLGLVEGGILEQLEQQHTTTLHELIHKMEHQPCIVSMGLGSLIRSGLIYCEEIGEELIIQRGRKTPAASTP
ncbi:MAG: hypothetical protein Q8R76_11535 [Candidatus Omnitrophota bacterium]|nr:hypothetical protein [Candidatus Omnitrophota bacterium]